MKCPTEICSGQAASGLRVSARELTADGFLNVDVDVRNTAARGGLGVLRGDDCLVAELRAVRLARRRPEAHVLKR